MRKVLAITHVAFEDLGSLEIELKQAGFEIEMADACTADLHAIDPLAADLLVVLGGPVGVYDHPTYPFLETELGLLRTRLAAQRPTLGLCLGAQLMTAALGAAVYPGANGKELGWFPVHAAPGASIPAWFAPLLEPGLRMLHWHGDTFDLPEGASHLAATGQYPNQAFSLGDYALALQFHPEVLTGSLERWFVGHSGELAQAGIDVRRLREDSLVFGPALEAAARRCWRQWLAAVFPATVAGQETASSHAG